MKFGSDTCNPFITLACDFKCPYCITKATPGWNFGYPHRDCVEWAAALNNLDDVKHIVLNGGEPTLRPGFADMIAAIAPSDAVWPNDWKIALGYGFSQLIIGVVAMLVQPKGVWHIAGSAYH